jgi:hypothetical protein
MRKLLTIGEVVKTIIIGIGKGILYYVVYYIILFGLIVYFLIPYFLNAMGYGSINVSSMISFNFISYRIIAWFLTLSIIGTFLVRHVPYGRAIDRGIGILLLYIVLSYFGFGRFSGQIGNYNIGYYVDLSPLFTILFYIITLFTIGDILVVIGKEYKASRAKREA